MLNGTKNSKQRTRRGGSACSVERISGGLPRFILSRSKLMVGCLAHNQNSAGSTPVSAITTKTTMRVIDETDLGNVTFHILLRRAARSISRRFFFKSFLPSESRFAHIREAALLKVNSYKNHSQHNTPNQCASGKVGLPGAGTDLAFSV